MTPYTGTGTIAFSGRVKPKFIPIFINLVQSSDAIGTEESTYPV